MNITLDGNSALIVIALVALILFIIFVYLPAKLIIIVSARVRQKTQRLELLHQRSVVAEYQPPDGLTPAEMGYLFDTKLGEPEIYATILQLQSKGLLVIIETETGLTVGQAAPEDVTDDPLEKFILLELAKKQGATLNKKLLNGMIRHSANTVNEQLRNMGYLKDVKTQIHDSLARMGAIMALLFGIFPLLAFKVHTLDGLFYSFIFIFFVWPVYLAAAILLYSNYRKIAGEPWLGTEKLKSIWTNIEGYREYIQEVDADNLAYDSDMTRDGVRNKALPYAIALGFNTEWMKKL